MTPPGEPPKRIVVPTTTRREMIVSIVCGAGILGIIAYGIAAMGSRQQKATTNTLTGKIQKKTFTPAPEEQISFGRKGLKSEKIAGEYVLEVFVKTENRTFEVPVDANTYEAVRIGDSFTFIRPRSEQVK